MRILVTVILLAVVIALRYQTGNESQMQMIQVGDRAPSFSATAVGGEYGAGRSVSLDDFKGRILVLYFYPKDDTPGCTVQACALRDSWQQFEHAAAVFGVSADPAASHQEFIDKFNLPFPLLSDDSKKMAEAYGVWVEKSMYGKKYMGIERTTFVIDKEQKISAILRKVKPDEHAGQLFDLLGT